MRSDSANERCSSRGRVRGTAGRVRPRWTAGIALLLSLVMLAAGVVEAAANCRPKRRLPPVVLKTMEPCAFDTAAAAFAGTPLEQAMCLLRTFDRSRNLGPMLERLPDAIATR